MPNKQLKMRKLDWTKRKLQQNKQLLMKKPSLNRMPLMLKQLMRNSLLMRKLKTMLMLECWLKKLPWKS